MGHGHVATWTSVGTLDIRNGPVWTLDMDMDTFWTWDMDMGTWTSVDPVALGHCGDSRDKQD